jgi:BlaI family transcriptional regulator, penicillinase repressor
MSRQIKPTESELEILNILWQEGPSAVRAVHDQLSKEAGYTTTLKLMQIMHEKGLLKRDDTARSHIYEAAVNKEQTQGQIVQRLIDNVFNGSAMSLVMQALGNHQSSHAEIEMIRAYLDQASADQKKKKKGSRHDH